MTSAIQPAPAAPGTFRRVLPPLIVVVFVGAFAWAMASAAAHRLLAGNAYPEFSSLRADPDGAKLLFDSLSKIPGLRVERSYLPVNDFSGRDAAIFVLGIWPAAVDGDEDLRHSLEEIAGRGNRVILGFRNAAGPVPQLEKAWGIQFAIARGKDRSQRVSLATSKDWKALDAGKTAAERTFGAGSIVVCAESSSFTNEAILSPSRLPFLASVIGPAHHIVFDEEHFGFAISGSVAGLARHYRLTGLAFGLALVGVLFLWKNSFGFPPPMARGTPALEGRTSQAGLTTLLRRHIPASELTRACWEAWLEANRHRVPSSRLAEIELIVRIAGADPLKAASGIRGVLRSKGGV